nr:MAG TPA: DNA directed DNA polymerase [Caudoviricetes sp.]
MVGKAKRNDEATPPLGFMEDVRLSDYEAEADKRLASFGKTDLYSTGIPEYDEWLGHGGIGVKDGYEMVLLFGLSGCGKSSIAVRTLLHSVQQGIPQGWLILEDSPADTLNRLCMMAGDRKKTIQQVRCVHMLSDEFIQQGFRLDNIIEWIKVKSKEGIKLFLIDHLQFAFENSDDITESNEVIAQRIFMKKLNFLAKTEKLTVLMVSHISKNNKAVGMDKVIGSSAIVQASTKVLEVFSRKDGSLGVYMWKSRFTELPFSTAVFARSNMRYEFATVLPEFNTEEEIQQPQALKI